MARLTAKDKKWLAKYFPGLGVVERPKFSLVQGQLHFRRTYDNTLIDDTYNIRLELFEDGTLPPRITETDGRLERVLNNHPEFNGKPVELHINSNGTLCLAAPQELRLKYLPKPNIRMLFNDYVVPYFYSQSYFETHGVWPWPHLPHDSYGIIEWFIDNAQLAGAARETVVTLRSHAKAGNRKAQRIVDRAMRRESFSPNGKCLCGSGKSHMQCHRVLMKLALAFRAS